MQPQLAIIIPYFKIDYFEETIKSVAEQTDRRFTLYIGNDASPDDPLPLIKKYFTEKEFHYFDYRENVGGKNLALQWERVLENVKEEWFQILGDDDLIAENFVEKFFFNLPFVIDKKITTIRFAHSWIDENNNLIEKFDCKEKVINSVEFFKKKYRGKIRSSLSENIFALSSYKKHHFDKLPLAWGSDDFAILAFSQGKNFYYISESRVLVRISSVSISGSSMYDAEKIESIQAFRELLIFKYQNYFGYKFIHDVINEYIDTAYRRKENISFKTAFFYLKSGKPLYFLKAIKKIMYVRNNL